MRFAEPQLLYALAALPVSALFLVWADRLRRVAIARLGDPELVGRLSSSVNLRGRRWRLGLWWLALALILLALARPQWGSRVELLEQRGVQIMVALDISQSMLAQDIKPDRLSRAKLEIVDMMSRLGGDEVGLVLFSGASFIQLPLTSDYATARIFLEGARPGMISRPGTVIAEAIGTALKGFDEERESQKVIVLMTDGENHEANPLEAARRAAVQNVRIYTFGFGSSEGEPIPELNAQGAVIGFKRDRQGEVVLSRLDDAILRQIARVTGGRYYQAGAGPEAVKSLVSELDSLKHGEMETEFEIRRIERFQMFLAVALAALVLAELIPDRRPRVGVGRRGGAAPL